MNRPGKWVIFQKIQGSNISSNKEKLHVWERKKEEKYAETWTNNEDQNIIIDKETKTYCSLYKIFGRTFVFFFGCKIFGTVFNLIKI